jgi:hypothetical protein
MLVGKPQDALIETSVSGNGLGFFLVFTTPQTLYTHIPRI